MLSTNKYFTLSIAVIGIAWLLYAFYQYIAPGTYQEPFYTDGIIQHKTGELFIFIAYALAIVWKRFGQNKVALHYGKWLQGLAIAGGLINLVAWFQLRHQVDWSSWCLILLAAGLGAPYMLPRLSGKAKR